jgi:GTP cyclohydrolase FolE2
MVIPDVQNWPDDRGIGLDEVGVTGVRYPVSVFDATQGKQDTVASGVMDCECGIAASARGDDVRILISARVPVTSVCPCSKAVSDYGAHNQRSHITIEVEPAAQADDTQLPVWMEDLITVAEAAASSSVYPVLKRADERHVTMYGYDHPVFVEDMARAVAQQLQAEPQDRALHRGSGQRRKHSPPQRLRPAFLAAGTLA